MKAYKAPWSTSLIVLSAVFSVMCIALALQLFLSGLAWATLIPLAIVLGGLLFTVRGYTVTRDAILVHRLLWSTRLPLSELKSAEVAPDIARGGLRLFGNGGLFSFSGLFRNRSLGTYRAFLTDLHRTVVLHFSRGTVVVSPSSPEDFVHDVTESRANA